MIVASLGILALLSAFVSQPISLLQHKSKPVSRNGFSQLVGGQQKISPTPTPKPSVPPPLPGERAIKVPVLLYHYISVNPYPEDTLRTGLSTTPDVFDQQLALLKSQGFTTITFDELAAAFEGTITLPPKPVILTVDDGYSDFYFNAYPILAKHQMKAINFIPTGLIGGDLYMTWKQIEELANSPYVMFGSHTVRHSFLPKVSPGDVISELTESKRVLEQHVGYNVNWFAYPYGAFDEAVVYQVKKAGFVGAVTTMPGMWQYKSHFVYIPRFRAGNLLGDNLLKLVY